MPRCFAPPPFRSFLDGQSIDVPSNVGRNGLVRTRRSKSGPRISLPVGLIRGGTTHRRVTRDQLLFYHESFLHRFRIIPFFASARISRARARLLYDANYSIGGTAAGDIGRRSVPVTWPGNHAVRFALEIESKPPHRLPVAVRCVNNSNRD